MLSQKVFASFNPASSAGSLAELSISLLEDQKKKWPLLAEGYQALSLVKVREIHCAGFSTKVQWNSKRMVSTAAKVDAASIGARKCFLCLENLPQEQQGVLYGNDFIVLCNPAPIFSRHYTISHVRHVPQAIEGFIGTFLMLARDLGGRFTVFYNGPKCGASAPDHFHFQASPSGAIPVESESNEAGRRMLMRKFEKVSGFMLLNYGRGVLLFESSDADELEKCMTELFRSMRKIFSTTEEPMVNILCSFQDNAWRVIVFPRSKHRPAAYFREGDAKVLISPASVDIGGLIITPVEKDFQKVDATTIEDIFREVSVDTHILKKIIDGMSYSEK